MCSQWKRNRRLRGSPWDSNANTEEHLDITHGQIHNTYMCREYVLIVIIDLLIFEYIVNCVTAALGGGARIPYAPPWHMDFFP